jgi:hypothetical protein
MLHYGVQRSPNVLRAEREIPGEHDRDLILDHVDKKTDHETPIFFVDRCNMV